LAGGAFIQVFIKETQGLSDADKMTLYLPKEVQDAQKEIKEYQMAEMDQ